MGNYNFLKSNNKIKSHTIFLFILYLYYFFPFAFTGSLLTQNPDLLDSSLVYNYIAGKIILGNFEAIKIFLNGELPWQFLKGIFYPITLIYSFLDPEKAFWITDIILKTLAYFSFYYLMKRINPNSTLIYLLPLLFASSISNTVNGIGLVTIPLFLGIILKKKKFNLKNYFIIFFIGLNSDLYLHGIYVVLILFFLNLILNKKDSLNKSHELVKIFSTYIFAIILSNSQLFYSAIYLRPFHSEEMIKFLPSLIENFKSIFTHLYSGVTPHFYINIFFLIFIIVIYFFSFTKKIKVNILILSIILFTSILNFIFNLDFFNNLKSNYTLLVPLNLNRFNQLYYFLYSICFIFLFENLKLKIKNYMLVLTFFAVIYNLTSPNVKTVLGNFFYYYNLSQDQKKIVVNNYNNYEFVKLFRNLDKFKKNEFIKQKKQINSYTSSSIKTFYQFEDYKFIKGIVKNDRIISIGIEPLKAVMSNINVIDGYHYLYPLSYKEKFKKIYNKKSVNEDYIGFIAWGHRLQISNYDLNLINLEEVKKIGAEYILSNKVLNSSLISSICIGCNNAAGFNLYKIN